MEEPIQLEGIKVTLDRLTHFHDPETLPPDAPHAFIYHLSIHNHSQYTVTFHARKWVIHPKDGTAQVVEGEKITGKTPTLKPGQVFSYNSYHAVACHAQARGSFHGVDENKRLIFVPIPEFDLVIPEMSDN